MAIAEIDLINERQLSELLGIAIQTARNWRSTGRGPAYVKLGGRSVRYRVVDVQDFIESGLVKPDGE